jgi:hypothetical protein
LILWKKRLQTLGEALGGFSKVTPGCGGAAFETAYTVLVAVVMLLPWLVGHWCSHSIDQQNFFGNPMIFLTYPTLQIVHEMSQKFSQTAWTP